VVSDFSLFCQFCENFWPNMKCCKVYISVLRRSCHSSSRWRTPGRFLIILWYKLPSRKDCFHIIIFPFFLQSDCLLQLKLLGGEHGDLRCCVVDVFFNAVMRWIKSQLAVLRWSQTLRCAMFVFFTLRCSVKWNCLRCWGCLIYLSQT